MKTFWKIFWIVLGLLIFLGGCGIGGGMGAFMVELFGAMIMMIGLLPIIDKELLGELKGKE